MPKDDLKELICDWIGAGKIYMGSDFTFEKELKYVSSRMSNAKMHNNTRDAIYRIFVLLSESDLDFNTIVNYVLIYY